MLKKQRFWKIGIIAIILGLVLIVVLNHEQLGEDYSGTLVVFQTSEGVISIAPLSSGPDQFWQILLENVAQGYYENTSMHRVVRDGGYRGAVWGKYMTNGSQNEQADFFPRYTSGYSSSNTHGTVGFTTLTGGPGGMGSVGLFVNLADNSKNDGQRTTFAYMMEGLALFDEVDLKEQTIQDNAAGEQSQPEPLWVIYSARLENV